MTSDEERPINSADWDHEDDFEDIDTTKPVLAYVREGNVGRFVTTFNKGAEWIRVFRKVAQIVETGEILEEAWIQDNEDRYWWRQLPHKKRVIRSTCHYYANSEEESATSMAMPATSKAAPASSMTKMSPQLWNRLTRWRY